MPAPLQEGVAVALETLGDDYYDGLKRDYRRRRDILCAGLVKAGFKCQPPQGAYYVIANFADLSDLPDDRFAEWLTIEHGVATVPGSSFCSTPELGRDWIRFAFCKTEDMLKDAVERLRAVRSGRRPEPAA
jgi:aspartate/methionine/tyrosine aminotransferase